MSLDREAGLYTREASLYTLEDTHALLFKAIGEAIDLFKRTLRYPNPSPVIYAIEQFVHEIKLAPDWFAELERRVSFIDLKCGPGSRYAGDWKRALDSYTEEPQRLCRGSIGIEYLRTEAAESPSFLAEVVEVRKSAEAVLEETELDLSQEAMEYFTDWRYTCRAVQYEAQELEVDGCWYLYHTYRQEGDDSPGAMEILRTDLGCVNLDLVLAASNSIMAWVDESSIDSTNENEITKDNFRAKWSARREGYLASIRNGEAPAEE
jgi:hypothetical protein